MKHGFFSRPVVCVLFLLIVGLPSLGLNAQADDVYVTAAIWSHDGGSIAVTTIQNRGQNNTLMLLDGQTYQPRYRVPTIAFASLAWSPDDLYIALGSYDSSIRILEAATGREIAVLSGHSATVTWLDWNTDGTRLVSAGTTDETIIIWDMVTSELLQRIRTSDAWAVSYSPDGQSLAVGALAGLFIVPADAEIETDQELLSNRFDSNYIGSVAWQSDSRLIAFATQTFNVAAAQINVIDTANRALIRETPTGDERIFGLDWSYDGGLVASHGVGGTVRVWDTSRWTQLETYIGSSSYTAELSFSPYGGRLAFGLRVSAERAARAATIEDMGVAVVVPAPSVDRVNVIAALCMRDSSTRAQIDTVSAPDAIPAFIAQVEALPESAIPPACKADLLAVARAVVESE